MTFEALNTGHLSIKTTAFLPHSIKLHTVCIELSPNERHLSIKDRQLGSSGVLFEQRFTVLEHAT